MNDTKTKEMCCLGGLTLIDPSEVVADWLHTQAVDVTCSVMFELIVNR